MPKEDELPDEETDRAMYVYTKERLAQDGFERYEISNYAKPGYESRHNSSYWIGTEYLGVGLGASSLFTNARYHNESDLNTYLAAVQAGEDIRKDMERLVVSEQMEEFMMLGLRMMCGVSRAEFQRRFGCAMETVYGQALKKLERNGLIVLEGDRVALTETGIDVSNQVFLEFIPEDFVRR
jgi:oxygen-independent coproporphyrinogen-3 oxidase